MTYHIGWEQRLAAKLSDLSAAIDFLDLCRSPENIELAKETGALKDAHEWLEKSARNLKLFSNDTMSDCITEYYTDRTTKSWHGH